MGEKPILPPFAAYIIDKLVSAGFEAYAVGGCVRDMVMGRVPHDYDVTTSALPAQVKRAFSTDRVIETGLKHGTVTVLSQGIPVEVTTYRIDGDYGDNRHPKSVTFVTSLADDLSRRDFTANAMAFGGDEVVDLFGGREDIKNRIIRCVGEPRTRFAEDGLRILRAIRFASALGFAIEPKTAKAVHEQRELLQNISRERILSEFVKTLCGEGASEIATEYADVINTFIPDFAADRLPKLEILPPERVLRMSAFFFGFCNSDGARRTLGALRADNLLTDGVCDYLQCLQEKFGSDRISARRLVGKLGADRAIGYIHLLRVCRPDMNSDELEKSIGKVVSDGDCCSVKSLAIGGRELLALGIDGSPRIGKLLSALLEAVITDKLPNERTALLAEAAKISDKID